MTLNGITRCKEQKDDRQMEAGNEYITAHSSELYRLCGHDDASEWLQHVHPKIGPLSFSINLIAAS